MREEIFHLILEASLSRLNVKITCERKKILTVSSKQEPILTFSNQYVKRIRTTQLLRECINTILLISRLINANVK